ncbi:hypothetical protein F5890DRAFT_1478670 [Lentinula detonsa]|uniref:Uncharacterized protein n=1 Tax=Lentinula detonsa TaxID=2804962 RepID=A0AA38UPP1_9AGAR|nr:hypothetical protein F5890DRAFT_1478670 [Lentinula detonsa]
MQTSVQQDLVKARAERGHKEDQRTGLVGYYYKPRVPMPDLRHVTPIGARAVIISRFRLSLQPGVSHRSMLAKCNNKCMLEGVACKPLLVVACKILAAIASAHSITTVPMNFLMTIQSVVSPMSGYFLAATVLTFIALRSISEPVSQLIWLPALVNLQITEFGFGPAPPALCHSRQNESTSHAGLLPATTFLIPPGTSSGQMKVESTGGNGTRISMSSNISYTFTQALDLFNIVM